MDECILCKKRNPLSDSHILPKSFFKKLKNGSPQLIKANTDLSSPPSWDNANWNEKLLCSGCEHFLNVTYESSQISFLRAYKTVSKSHDRLTFKNFNFKKFYLMWLSVLWRASESSLEAFKNVDLGPDLNEIIRMMIMDESTAMSGHDANDFIKIGIIRIMAPEIMDDRAIQKMLTGPMVKTHTSGFSFFFIVEGFLILYVFSTSGFFDLPKKFGEIKHSGFLRVPRVHVFESPHALEIFTGMSKVVDAHHDWVTTL